jgi:DNA polymerase-3 subunit gamma/tau
MAKRKPASDGTTKEKPLTSDATATGDYTVLARRYRPRQFGDLVGQEPVAQALANALQSHRVAHAYLFTGARGVGKTSTARILAKALNCSHGPTITPCDECEMCRAIASGEDIDVLEIDGASNRGIDEVREIRQNVQYRPSRGRYKIYIIDEVHMLTTPAFNALLKTLEEPPPHVKFIFATTEVQKIPVTILSRCQRFDFGGISLPRIVERLRQIVAAEGMQADADALELIARRASGSMRDAQSLLDQLLAFGGQHLTAADVHGLLGTANEERVAALADAVLRHDARQALLSLADMVNQGQQLGELLDQLIEYWRDLMVVHSAGAEGQDLSVTGVQRQQLSQQAGELKLDTIVAGLDILVAAKARMRLTSHTRVLMEMALVRLSQLEDLVPLTQLARWVQQEGGPPASARPISPGRSVSTTPAGPSEEKKKLTPNTNTNGNEAVLPFSEENLEAIWTKVLSEVGFAIAGLLKKISSLAIAGPNTLVLRVSQRYNSPAGAFLDSPRLARLEEVLLKTTGQTCQVKVEVLKEEDPARSPDAGRTGSAPATSPLRQQRAEIMQLPLVKKAVEALGAQFIKADEGFGTPTQGPPAPTEPPEDE